MLGGGSVKSAAGGNLLTVVPIGKYCTMNEKRSIVKNLVLQDLARCDIYREAKMLNVSRQYVFNTLKRWQETGDFENRRRKPRERTVRTSSVIKVVRERIRRNPVRSTRKLSLETGINRNSIRSILKHDLGLKALKKRKNHGLTGAQIQKRLQRSKALLERHAAGLLENLIFSDEKNFVLEEQLNSQNHRYYAVRPQDVPQETRTVSRYQNASSVMVWGAVSENGALPLVFVEKGVKINSTYYEHEILEKKLKNGASTLYPDKNWTFQQDSAPAHASKRVQQWLGVNCPSFINKDDWPPSSPDLNPLDFFVWGYLSEKVNEKKCRTLDSFKRTIVKEWDKMDQNMLRAACRSFPARLRKVIKAKGDRFE